LIAVNSKSSVITLESSNSIAIGISDPTQTNTGSITVTLNRAASGLLSADLGITVVQLAPQIILSVNVNGSHGKTFQGSFSYSPPPFAITATRTGTNIVISFPTQSGFNYQVQYKNDLTDAVWNPLGSVAGDNTVKSITDPVMGNVRFYRAEVQ
jgi:hyaluronate lyase